MNNDLISRQALKEALHNFFDGKVIDEPAYILRDVFCHIDSAPTVEAVPLEHHNKIKGIMDNEIKSLVDILDNERPQGEWKVEGALIACNKCGQIMLKASKLYNFCPNCGAQMIGGANE